VPLTGAAYMVPLAEAERLVAAHLRGSVGEMLATVPRGAAGSWDGLLGAVPVTDHPLALPQQAPHPWRGGRLEGAMRAAVAPHRTLLPTRGVGTVFGAVNPGFYWRTPCWGNRDAARLVQATRRIAIMMHNQDAFSNGCMQNGYFLWKTLREMGYAVDMVLEVHDPDTKRIPFACGLLGGDHFIKPLRRGSDELCAYGLILYSTRTPTPEFAAALEGADVARVGFKCGNTYMLDVEEFVNAGDNLRRSYAPMQDRYHASVSDEIWTVSLLEHAMQYYRTVCRVPVFQVPHTWGMDFFDAAYRADKQLPPTPPGLPPPRPNWEGTLRGSTGSPIDLLCVEPSVSTVKHPLLVLAIAQALHDRAPGRLGVLHAYCWPDTPTADAVVDGYPVFRVREEDGPRKGQRKHIQYHKRERVTHIADCFARSDRPVVVVHHHDKNAANYATLEFATLGFPIVHNSKIYGAHGDPDVATFGYYYKCDDELFNIDGAVAQVLHAADSHGNVEADQRLRAAQYNEVHNSPTSRIVQAKMRGMVRGALDRCAAKREAALAALRPTVSPW